MDAWPAPRGAPRLRPSSRALRHVILRKASSASTNDDARELALAGAPHGASVLALRQEAGRGRAGRAFASPEGGLYLSVVLRPRAPPAQWGLLPLAVGLAAAEALEARGHRVALKWPNDLLTEAGKVGGVLVETRLGEPPFAVAGLGINLGMPPAGVDGAAGLGEKTSDDVRAAAEGIRARLLEVVEEWESHPERVRSRIRSRCRTLGRRVAWDGGAGVAVDVAEDGALLVEGEGGRARIVAGDVRVSGS